MMHTCSIDPLTDQRWLPFLASSESATVFHHPAWIETLIRTYHYKSASLACVDGDQILGVLPLLEIRSRLTGKRGVGLPFSDYGGAVAVSDAAHAALVDAAIRLQGERGWEFVELRGPVAHPGAQVAASFKRHTLRLDPDVDRLYRTFDKGQNQRSVAKFLKSGAVVERRTDPDALRAFMRLNYQTRRKHGLPPQPDRFFDELQKLLLDRTMGFVSLARREETVLAACVFLLLGKTVYYKFGASDEAHLAHRPNHGIMWDAIRWAAAEGYTTLDFGRSDLDGEGLIRFKRGWGTVETDLTYVRLGCREHAKEHSGEGLLERAKPLIQRMPLPVLKMIGKILYEHVG
jgi:CelD/BcsL family acetyltransferase involved in cellulose biosynthesis